ncbi:gamma-interferon-inducible lysosomal thiol reductase-like [Cylas formicarius]|uniref:gamma-interferon-inducible lysosomal thiol reductase-like n=1 Tax=Cylas formicarius TaxID=197179 RepID=UPI002958DF5D|nr:gamma-interferon-inducible lysosomal thiol reductase-like [Cylas formicarius]XP_060516316.1 gamma-interferon-inducible lysosomal thiol reductase-like [Cylas formicarius]
MNPKYSRILATLVIVIILYKAFQHYVFPRKPIIEQIIRKNEFGEDVEKVKVSVYYEALCPDSKFFITGELLPLFDKLKSNIEIDLVPYGKAETTIGADGTINFRCQHESLECVANKIHSCVIEHVTDQELRLRYIACMITDNMKPEEAGERCGRELDIDFSHISNCAADIKGSQLLKHYGERTHALNPGVRFIPTIELNDSQSFVPQKNILKDLFKSVCHVFKRKPEMCEQ